MALLIPANVNFLGQREPDASSDSHLHNFSGSTGT
jgi:hypothetical protein